MCDLVRHSFGNYNNSLRQGQKKYSSSFPADRTVPGLAVFGPLLENSFEITDLSGIQTGQNTVEKNLKAPLTDTGLFSKVELPTSVTSG